MEEGENVYLKEERKRACNTHTRLPLCLCGWIGAEIVRSGDCQHVPSHNAGADCTIRRLATRKGKRSAACN